MREEVSSRGLKIWLTTIVAYCCRLLVLFWNREVPPDCVLLASSKLYRTKKLSRSESWWSTRAAKKLSLVGRNEVRDSVPKPPPTLPAFGTGMIARYGL